MGNFTASIIVYVLTVVAFMLAVLVQQYHLYLFSSELAGYWGLAAAALGISVLVTYVPAAE
jgi:hypothetical protein